MQLSPSLQEVSSEQICKTLLELEAVRLNLKEPFQWASGWLSPIYCDNRLLLSPVSSRRLISQAMASHIAKAWPEAEVIAGVATAGIAWGALVADLLEMPFVYVRSKPKGHGMGKQIEGKISARQRVVVVEDLISTGGSSIKAAEALRHEADAQIEGLISIFNYGFDAAVENFNKAGLDFYSLADYPQLIELAKSQDYVAEQDLDLLMQWRANPSSWSPSRS
jgi:orotate phosphoribosyltransferase